MKTHNSFLFSQRKKNKTLNAKCHLKLKSIFSYEWKINKERLPEWKDIDALKV